MVTFSREQSLLMYLTEVQALIVVRPRFEPIQAWTYLIYSIMLHRMADEGSKTELGIYGNSFKGTCLVARWMLI